MRFEEKSVTILIPRGLAEFTPAGANRKENDGDIACCDHITLCCCQQKPTIQNIVGNVIIWRN